MSLPKGRKNDKKAVGCPVEITIAAIGGRWKVLIIHHLLEGTKRFDELARALKGVSARTLTRQLRELEASGVVHREVYRQIPPMVEYSLTPAGKRLEPILRAMHEWGKMHAGPVRPSTESDRTAQHSPSQSGRPFKSGRARADRGRSSSAR